MRVPNLIKLFQRVMLSRRPIYLLAKQSHQFAEEILFYGLPHGRLDWYQQHPQIGAKFFLPLQVMEVPFQ